MMRNRQSSKVRAAGVAAALLGLLMPAHGQLKASDFPSSAELRELSLEDLLELQVTSVSKRPEPLDEAASAIQVITGESIRRSGAINLADALRLAPNLGVQQINSHAWAVSARGFNALFANKLLVMIDGRSVYTPLFAGVFWDVQNVLLEDIDRIEVISGPGGALWGANAVNGVINVITKGAEETQGLYLSGAVGSFMQDFAAARYGGSAGPNTYYRVYGQRFAFDGTRSPGGGETLSAWHMTQGGFRVDHRPTEVSHLTIQSDLYQGTEYNAAAGNSRVDGQNVLGRWTRSFANGSEFQAQLYFDRTWRDDLPSEVADEMRTYDLDLQHTLPVGNRQTIVWGTGYRLMQNDTQTGGATQFLPRRRNMQLFSAFVQDEIILVPDHLSLRLGSKVEHNDFSGFEVQPSARVAWVINDRHTLWSAVSRAVRSPSRIDADFHIPGPPPTPPFAVAGGPDFDSEEVIAYELGYRVRPTERMSLSLATFYNDYDKLYSVEPEDPTAPIPVFTIQNGTNGHSWGAELSGTYQMLDWWRVRGGYTFFRKELWSRPGHDVAPNVLASLGNDPQNQVVLQSMMDLPGNFEFDVTSRYVDSLSDPAIPSYLLFDVRLAWRIDNLELSVVGRNLGDNRHPEFSNAEQIPHSVHARVTWRY